MEHDTEIRYARQISLQEIGAEGQAKLAAARVLVIGAGGLGSPLSLYLAAAGIGHLGLVDHDRVALSNLQRQILFETGDIGRLKVDAASDRLHELNPTIHIETYAEKLGTDNAASLIAHYDIIADGCDNFETRFLVNATCHRLRKPLISAAIQRFSGQIYSFTSYKGDPYPCYQCLYAELPPPGTVPTCREAGILGAIGGVMGSLQAVAVIRHILGLDKNDMLNRSILRYDALAQTFRSGHLPRNPGCAVCAA